MTPLHSRAAFWLLECCCRGSHRSSLVGDVLEEFAMRRQPPFWLWKQVVAAIVLSIPTDVHAHPQLAVRALLIGSLVLPIAQFGAMAVTDGALPAARAFATGCFTSVVLAGVVCRYPFGVVIAFAGLYSGVAVLWTAFVGVRLPSTAAIGYAAHQSTLIVMTVAGLAAGVLIAGQPRPTAVPRS